VTVDLFGTLIRPVDGAGDHRRRRELLLDALEGHGHSVAIADLTFAYRTAEDICFAEVATLRHSGPQDVIRLMLEHLRISWTPGLVDALESAIVPIARARWDVLPGAEEFLDRAVAAGLRLAVISNVVWQTGDDLDAGLEDVGLRQYLASDAVVCSEAVGFYKPRMEPFSAAMEVLDLSPEVLVHVGDDFVSDYLGARAAGMDAIFLDKGRADAPTAARRADGLNALLGADWTEYFDWNSHDR